MNVCFYIFLSSFFTQVNGQDMKLVAGHVLFRHGDRTPISTYPTDPAKEADWPNGYGQLTSTGVEQHHRLGQYLRTRYDSILSSTYKPREILVRSTDYDRTLMSAQSNLVGLYPVMNISDDQVPIQPIPIHTIPTAEDFLLGVNNCSRYDELEHDVYQGEEFKRMNDYYGPFFQKLQVWTDISNITMYNAWDIADTIFIEHIYNKTPAWATDDVRKNLSAVNDLSFHFLFADNGTKRLRGGPLIKEMWSNMRNVKQGESHHKVKMYSAHDTTISAVLAFLRINYPHQPSYASALFLDLYKQNTTYYVRVEYLNVTDSKQPYPYVLNGCPSINCPLETFTGIYEPIFPDSMDVECGKKNMPPGGGGNKVLIIVLSVIVVALALIIVAVFLYLFRRKPDEYDPLPSTDSPMPVA